MPDKVLIVTGTMISAKESSLLAALRKQRESLKASSGAWLDIQTKLHAVELLLSQRMHLKSKAFRRSPYRDAVEAYFRNRENFDTPELTEVLLATLLEAEGLDFEVSTFTELYADRVLRSRLLDECPCVLLSTTLLRDLSELLPLAKMLKRPDNKVVMGGALTSMLHSEWRHDGLADVLAVGSGELLVPRIAGWIRSGYKELNPPSQGRIEQRGDTVLLFSGVHGTRNLDHLVRPDWELAARYHGRSFGMVYYESVRGCPYRCSFCNYPFLFDDNKFRTKSAGKIAADWAHYTSHGVKTITCLDSLFTMPKRRLVELCDQLLREGTEVDWICYARADDLADLETCRLMRRAGCIQVQIGLESGNQRQLDNMNKKCTVEQNRIALENCRKAGIASVTTVIIGFPGETPDSIDDTFRLLKETPPDLYYAAAFNTRFEYVPILEKEQAERFGLQTLRGGHSSIPYWRHDSMSSTEVAHWQRRFSRRMAEERVSLDGMLFYSGFLGYRAEQRADLLDFQRDLYRGGPLLRGLFGRLDRWAHARLEADVERVFGNGPETA
jgi:anaerobic magnesium-protoporphyrin IX monomethyl ester cyclase